MASVGEDTAATQSLGQAIHCLLSGWDDFVSCADPEAAPDRCDPDDPISRASRRASGNPIFRTRAEARAWCAAKVAQLRTYAITETDMASFGSPVGPPVSGRQAPCARDGATSGRCLVL